MTEDVIYEILIRLPAKALGRFKLVSKKWNSQISDPKFAKSHAQFSNRTNSSLIIGTNNVVSCMKFDDISKGLNLLRLSHSFPSTGRYYVYFCLGSCDGLVCIHIKTLTLAKLMYLWNPTTKQSREIVLPMYTRANPKNAALDHVHGESWFGFVPSLNDCIIFLVESHFERSGNRIHMYSMKKAGWRELQQISIDLYKLLGGRGLCISNKGSKAVFLNEALHTSFANDFILIFDLTKERIEKVSLPPTQIAPCMETRLCLLQDDKTLCAIRVHGHPKLLFWGPWRLEVWALEQYNRWETWQKLFKIELGKDIAGVWPQLLGFPCPTKILIRGNGNVLVHPSRHGPPLFVQVSMEDTFTYTINYVETLVSPFSFPS